MDTQGCVLGIKYGKTINYGQLNDLKCLKNSKNIQELISLHRIHPLVTSH